MLYSRCLLFGYAAPFTHTGFRVTAPITDAWTVQAGVNQGWDVILDNNAAKSFYLSNTLTPSSARVTINQHFQVRTEDRHDQLSGRAVTPQDTVSLALVAGI